MKNLFLAVTVFSSTVFFAQKSENYYEISYNSICCGTPSTTPVMNYIENFQKKNKGKVVEIFRQSGLGREGEFKLFIGIDPSSKTEKQNFVEGLKSTINAQNKSRTENRDGMVEFSFETIKKEKLKLINNLTIYKKEKLK